MSKLKILSVVGARPNFIKIAPLHRAFLQHPNIQSKILHTGQHHDENMSDIFFNELNLPQPNFQLAINGNSPISQQAQVMLKFEKILKEERPDIVLVVGDVNASIACSLVAVHSGIKAVHVEAGLRSGDRTMPEEINRIITDAICDDLFVTEQSGIINLQKEGIPKEKIHFVGNLMIDTLLHHYKKTIQNPLLKKLQLYPKAYILMTIHRPSNVDNQVTLRKNVDLIQQIAKYQPIIFPLHPRTRKYLKKYGLMSILNEIPNFIPLKPQGYFNFLYLMNNAILVLTDSGGIQEETTFLKVPCLTLRKTTERPITTTLGTNLLIKDFNIEKIIYQIKKILTGNHPKGTIPPLWDGHTAQRITDILHVKYNNKLR